MELTKKVPTTDKSQENNHLLRIRNNTRGNWLVLTTREMHAHSRIDIFLSLTTQ